MIIYIYTYDIIYIYIIDMDNLGYEVFSAAASTCVAAKQVATEIKATESTEILRDRDRSGQWPTLW